MTKSDPHSNRDPSVDITITARELCLRFVEEFESGGEPDLESFMVDVPAEYRPEVLAELVNVDLLQRRAQGQNPSKSEYIKKFPLDGPTISAAFDAISDTVGDQTYVTESAIESTEIDLAIGDQVGKYEIRSVLGRGGMGIVFGAFDTVILREVALKLLSRKHAGDESALNRLLQEAQAVGAVHHPNIIGIYDVLEENDSYYLVMEKVSGENLGEVLNSSEQGRLDWKTATQVIIDCCNGLAAAHQQGLIHRDLKPMNIMLTDDSSAKLLDFGLAKGNQSDETALTKIGTVLGTPDFMSPEQCKAAEVNPTSDIYSLGATYFALLTGHPPFGSLQNHLKIMFAHCHRPTPNILDELPELPPACNDIIQRAMAKESADRYQSAQEFRVDLEAVLNGGQPSGSTQSFSATQSIEVPPTPASPKKWFKVVTAACLVISIATWGITLLQDIEKNQEGRPTNSVTGPQEAGSEETATPPLFRGVTENTIHLGTSTAYNGPSQELGRNMVVGMKSCFERINDAGGIHGRKISLTVLDDRYQPEKALQNMQDFFEDRDVFAVIGNVGAPTARVTSKYASENSYLFFAPFSGASLLREDPPDRYVFNYRASYVDETAAMVKHFVVNLRIPPENIAVFAQNDAYGDDGFKGVAKAMREHGIQSDDLIRVGYERNQLDIDEAVSTILSEQAHIQAIVMVPTYKVAADFVKRIKTEIPEMVFGAVSFVGSQALAEAFYEIGPQFGDGVLVTQVVPHYLSNATGVRRYRQDLKKYYPEYEPGFVSLEGYIAAECFAEGLRDAGPNLNTESLIDALHSIRDLDLGIGPIIQFSPSRHQASHKVWGTQLNAQGEFEIVDLE
ncbi:ABC transporter substrate-binding protein [Thalassoglobus polymorphus]|uniref:non-specific serine/threonine protein kinase n=1 Tax=Thalassoglobus polymorphus TaxID=2527994 RepID=A0A517QNQ5_9PLAN|nr:ABC transporter substrate-binding protein [Thalassoglobus polymorphus]QDT33234.1 Serine/threonine-protein kinase PrkC [Thalassoglobus polymorphus]